MYAAVGEAVVPKSMTVQSPAGDKVETAVRYRNRNPDCGSLGSGSESFQVKSTGASESSTEFSDDAEVRRLVQ